MNLGFLQENIVDGPFLVKLFRMHQPCRNTTEACRTLEKYELPVLGVNLADFLNTNLTRDCIVRTILLFVVGLCQGLLRNYHARELLRIHVGILAADIHRQLSRAALWIASSGVGLSPVRIGRILCC